MRLFSSFFLILFFFIAPFLCERSIKLLFLQYKIVVHKNEIQKCKYLGHVAFIYHVWCFLYSKLFCKCASMLEYYAWKCNRLWICFRSFSSKFIFQKYHQSSGQKKMGTTGFELQCPNYVEKAMLHGNFFVFLLLIACSHTCISLF